MPNQVPLIYNMPEKTILHRGTTKNAAAKNANRDILYLSENLNAVKESYFKPNKGGVLLEFEVTEPLRLLVMNDPLTVLWLLEHENITENENASIKSSFKLSNKEHKLVDTVMKENGSYVVRDSIEPKDTNVAKAICRLGYDGYYGREFDNETQNHHTTSSERLKKFHSEVALCKSSIGKLKEISGIFNAPNSASPRDPVPRVGYNGSSNPASPMGPVSRFGYNGSPPRGRRLGFN